MKAYNSVFLIRSSRGILHRLEVESAKESNVRPWSDLLADLLFFKHKTREFGEDISCSSTVFLNKTNQKKQSKTPISLELLGQTRCFAFLFRFEIPSTGPPICACARRLASSLLPRKSSSRGAESAVYGKKEEPASKAKGFVCLFFCFLLFWL